MQGEKSQISIGGAGGGGAGEREGEKREKGYVVSRTK